MPRAAAISLLWALSLTACSLSKPNPSYCSKNADCPSGRCNLTPPNMNSCVATDAGTSDTPVSEPGSDTPAPECTTNTNCTTAGKRVCDTTVGMCVGCLAAGDCSGTTPICEAKSCRGCRSDTECGTDPGVCLGDGHCATSGEVVFVEDKATGCPSPDGTSGAPYCTPNEAVAALTVTRRVMVIRGLVSGRLALNTTGISPVIIGRKNSTGDDGAIPASAATAVLVSSDDVLIRDLLIRNGGASTSKGVVVSGASTKLTLLRVNVSFMGMGLGVEANTGAELHMDRCVVENNSVGGLLINGVAYDISNSVFAGNGYGVRFNAPMPGSRFWFNTVLGATATICELTGPPTLSDSIVVGTNADCVLMNSITTMPTFSSARPYHLTGPLACPTAPTTFPDHDIDGDPRSAPIDCGADEYTP